MANQRNGDMLKEDEQNLRIDPGSYHDFHTDGDGESTRFWPKMFCDTEGNHCGLGGSGGPGQACVGSGGDYGRCAPPVDTKMEASFGSPALLCNPAAGELGGCDQLSVTLLDGYTLPFKLEAKGHCVSPDNKGVEEQEIDCSGLSLDDCPVNERLSGSDLSLHAVNPKTGKVAGCYAPCTRLVDDKWNTTLAARAGKGAQGKDVESFCCPAPAVSPEACQRGPAAKSAYVSAVHRSCRGSVGYRYDPTMRLMRCTAHTRYEATFYCPSTLHGVSTPLPPPAGSEDKDASEKEEPEEADELAEDGDRSAEASAESPELAAAQALTQPGAEDDEDACSAVCTTQTGPATCGFRIRWAATHRYSGQAEACDLALVLVLLDCRDVCGGCSLKRSSCRAAVANPGSVLAADALKGALPARSHAGASGGGDKAPSLPSPPGEAAQEGAAVTRLRDAGRAAAAARSAALAEAAEQERLEAGEQKVTAQRVPAAPKFSLSLPYTLAAVTVAVVAGACVTSVSAKLLGRQLPATRAAAAAAERGVLLQTGEQTPGGVNQRDVTGVGRSSSFAYEGLQQQDTAAPTASRPDARGWF